VFQVVCSLQVFQLECCMSFHLFSMCYMPFPSLGHRLLSPLIICGENKLRRCSLCSFRQLPVAATLSPIRPDIVLSTVFSHIITVLFFLDVKDKVSITLNVKIDFASKHLVRSISQLHTTRRTDIRKLCSIFHKISGESVCKESEDYSCSQGQSSRQI
jgi:hypothetical protein